MPRLPLLLSLTLALAACQSAHDDATSEDEAARETLASAAASLGEESTAHTATDTDDSACNADPVQELIGQRVSDELVTQALKDSGSSTARVLGPTDAATLDLSHTRLNLITDANGVIQTVHCG